MSNTFPSVQGARPRVQSHRLGRQPFLPTWERQTALHRSVVERKLDNRRREKEGEAILPTVHHLLFVEHDPVYTLGKSGSLDHLLLSEEQLAEGGFTFHKINRGGDITYHGPGQLVAYPIFDLEEFSPDVHLYVRNLEEVVIRTLADFGIAAERDAGFTGVWVPGDSSRRQPRRKICAIGVHLSRWTTLHGFAFNVRPNLTHFANIVPCGIDDADRAVTSLSVELGRPVELSEVLPVVEAHFQRIFGFDRVPPTKSTPAGI